jgi:hypothetical protein
MTMVERFSDAEAVWRAAVTGDDASVNVMKRNGPLVLQRRVPASWLHFGSSDLF